MPPPNRTALVHGSLVAFAAAIVARSAQVQLWQGRHWESAAERLHFAGTDVPAARGDIFDVSGVPLAQSRQLVRLRVAPKEVKDRRALGRDLTKLRVPRDWVQRATDETRAWVDIPLDFLPGDVASIGARPGIYPDAVAERYYTQREATRRVLGRIGPEGRAIEGVELAMDSVLLGRSGKVRLIRDAPGSRFVSPLDTAVVPQAGDDVVLTISQELQEISERALGDAISRMGAQGGDIVILDPQSGEIRAMASLRRDPRSTGSPALSEPYEPGSTIKPFTAAALLRLGRAKPEEVMQTGFRPYIIERRPITDDHPAAAFSLADVIRYSSNIGIIKFAQRLSAAEQFEALRDFGFGTPTGVPFPTEASGRLTRPPQWSKQSPASLAMGYEISVTPVQLVTAYAAIANGGQLLEPTLIREVRGKDGTVKYRHTRRVVRRVMNEETATTIRKMLIGAVQGGTADSAAIGSFEVGGKTGTAMRTEHGRYVAGAYTASFVGLFPAEKPQYVILVKLDNPTGTYYGGKTAAPVSRVVLEAALAARDAALDRRALASSPTSSRGKSRVASVPDTLTETRAAMPHATTGAGTVPYVVTLPVAHEAKSASDESRAVPDVHGLALRDAVRALHGAGFRVLLNGFGTANATTPPAGSMIKRGSLVRLVAGS